MQKKQKMTLLKNILSAKFLVLCIVLIFFSCRSIPVVDEVYNIKFDFEQGDIFKYRLIRTKHEIKYGVDFGELKTNQTGILKVLKKDSLTCELEWKITEINTEHMEELDTASLIEYKRMTESYSIKYLTDHNGEFLEILNWNDILNFQLNLMDKANELETVEKQEFYKGIREKLLKSFGSKERVEDMLIKEIKILHSLANMKFDSPEKRVEKVIPNTFGGEELPVMLYYKIEDIDKKNKLLYGSESYRMTELQKKEFVQNYFKRLIGELGISPDEFKDTDFDFHMESQTDFVYDYGNKILKKIHFVKKGKTLTVNEDLERTDVIEFEYLED